MILTSCIKKEQNSSVIGLLFHDGGPYHIETNPSICYVNQGTGFYMIGTSIMKELLAI